MSSDIYEFDLDKSDPRSVLKSVLSGYGCATALMRVKINFLDLNPLDAAEFKKITDAYPMPFLTVRSNDKVEVGRGVMSAE